MAGIPVLADVVGGNTMNADLFEQLAEAYARRDLLTIEKSQALPEEVKKILAEVEEEFEDKFSVNAALISELEARVKTAVIEAGETMKGAGVQAVFTKGRVTWDSKQLEGLMMVLPELAQARKEGQPSVSIRRTA